jgi:hypothetical protein
MFILIELPWSDSNFRTQVQNNSVYLIYLTAIVTIRHRYNVMTQTVVLMVTGLLTTPLFLHESIAAGGMGLQFFFYAIPVLSLALVVWAVASRHLSDGLRRVSMVAAILLAGG